MNITEIYTSRKLESNVPEELIQRESSGKHNSLGKWNATIFFVSRKKCLLITNSISRYSVFIPGIRKADFKNLSELFANALAEQLKRDNILSKELDIKELIGEVTLHPTNNDKPIIGTQNYILENIDALKNRYGPFENWNFKYLIKRINGIPYKQLGWLYPRKKMEELLDEFVS